MSPRVSGHRPGITTAVLAGVVATTLALAACGSDDADGDSTATSTTSSSSGAASTSAKESTEASEASESARPDASESAEPAPGDQPDGDRNEGENPEGAPAPEPANAPAGNPAVGDDAAQITALERGFAEDRTYSEYLRYTYEHTCNADLDQTVGGREAAMQDADANGELGQKRVSEVMGTLPTIHGVNDIRVNGDRATANLDQTMNGNRQTLPKNYVREDGQWRTCIA
ncbi:hypothetical protein PQI66_03710 [Corynebacterium sp. USCH3]|uniref:Rv0361 family membrane protein n=1 Tax=Corynebacterium sp. USCH3 TaxID=3024840 RepID=UPI0030AEEA45